MTEENKPAQTLAERALLRLRRLASGNGMAPAALVAMDTQESLMTLKGKLDITPWCETQTASYVGEVKGKDRRVVRSFSEMQAAATKHQNDFRSGADWVDAVRKEILAHPSKGWGYDGAKVSLPTKSVTYAATQICEACNGQQRRTCPQCQGRGTVICTQCQGRGKEECYHCLARGEDPQVPGQPCPICKGTRFATCRFCQKTGYLPCPTCRAERTVLCEACNGAGRMTHEIAVVCGAETRFSFDVEDLPSGLRRGLDRIGLIHLGEGHADIETKNAERKSEDGPPQPGAPVPCLSYQATLPYAEMRIDFVVKKAVVAVVGKRCAINGVPNFLDAPLRPYREKLRLVAQGKARLEEALEARALTEFLSIVASDKGTEREARKLYPFGFSSEAINGMLAELRLALNRTTFTMRAIVAAMGVVVSTAFFYALYMHDLAFALTSGRGLAVSVLFDLFVLLVGVVGSWAALNLTTLFVVRRRFPRINVSLTQKTGKTGAMMMSAIIVAFGAILAIMPVKPLWLAYLLSKLPF